MKVDDKLGPDPLVSALPARPIKENIVAVLRHVFDQVVGEAQIRRGQAKHLPELRVLDLDAGFVDLRWNSLVRPKLQITLNECVF